MRLSLLAAGLSLAGLSLAVAGCVTVQESVSGVTPSSKRQALGVAANGSPVLLRAVNSPYAGGDGAAASATAGHVTGAVPRSTVAFTAEPVEARYRQFQVVMAFDPTTAVSADAVCRAADSQPPVSREGGVMTILAAFCLSGDSLGGVTVRGPAPSGLGDPAYREMVRPAVASLFPAVDTERGRQGLDALRLWPRPGIRVNPAETIF